MKYELEEYHRDTPEDELLRDLKRVATALGLRCLTEDQYGKRGKFSAMTMYRRFGGWNEALHRAGLERSRKVNTSVEEYFENIERVWETLGRQPRCREMRCPLSEYSGSGYIHRFGSWRTALKAFVEYVNGELSSQTEQPPFRNDEATLKSRSEHAFGAPKTPRTVSWRLRFLVMRRDNFKCCLCGASPALQQGVVLEVDHKVPWSKGGETVLANLQTLCQVCNNGKSNLPLDDEHKT